MAEVRSYNEIMQTITETKDIEIARDSYKYIIENKYSFPLVQLCYAEETYYNKVKEILNFSMN